jgi:hypothetical protein
MSHRLISILVFAAILLAINAATLPWARRSRQRLLLEREYAKNQELEQFTLAQLISIAMLINTPDISAEELRRGAGEILCGIAARNSDGKFNALISDINRSISAELRKRRLA